MRDIEVPTLAYRVVAEGLVHVDHKVAVEVAVERIVVGIEAVVRVREYTNGRSITLVLGECVGVVPTHTSGYVEPVENLVLGAAAYHVAVAVVGTVHSLSHPVRVLHLVVVAEVPVLNVDAA